MHFFAYRCSLGHKNALCCSSLQSGPLVGLQRLTAVRGCGSGLGFLTKCPNYSINTPNVAKHPAFKTAIEGKLRVQSRASERLQDQIIEEINELENTKTEEALQFSGEGA